jgi:hypothetical protein
MMPKASLYRILELPLRAGYHGELFNADRHHFLKMAFWYGENGLHSMETRLV